MRLKTKVKVLQGSSLTNLEEQINNWLEENRDYEIKQVNITHVGTSELFGVIVYEFKENIGYGVPSSWNGVTTNNT